MDSMAARPTPFIRSSSVIRANRIIMSEMPLDHSTPSASYRYPPKPDLELAFQAVRKARIPQIPDVVFALRDELGRPEPDIRVAAELISRDVSLTGQVMKAVNSPLFRCRTKITNMHQAVAMMGIARLTNLVTAQAIQRMLGVTEGPAQVVWDGMMVRARAILTVAEVVGGVALDEAYLFGIMQNAGSLIFVEMAPDYGTEWVLRNETDPLGLMEYERKRLGVDHVTVGFLLAGNWRLPEHIALAIYHHHDSDFGFSADSAVGVLVALSKLAHSLVVMRHGNHEQLELPADQEHALRDLAIDDEDWAALCDRAQAGEWATQL